MAAGPWLLTNAAQKNLFAGTTRISVDTFKVALLLSTSNIAVTSTTYAALTNEVANGNGYTTGGASITLTQATVTGPPVIERCLGSYVEWTASGGDIVARYACLYEVGGMVVCYCLLDSTPADITIVDGGAAFRITMDTDGIFYGTYTP